MSEGPVVHHLFQSIPTVWMVVWIALACLGLGAAGSVWLAGRRQKLPVTGSGLRAVVQTAFWVVPALAVVALIGIKARSQRPGDAPPPVAVQQPARDPNLLWSRSQVTDPPEWSKAEDDEKKPGVVQPTSLYRRIHEPDQNATIVASTDPYATEEEATAELTPLVVQVVSDELRSGFPIPGDWKVPVRLINASIKSSDKLVLEQFDKDFGLGKIDKMYRLHCQVAITPELRSEVYRDWRSQVVRQRLTRLGGGAGLMVGLTAMFSLCLGLNSATGGQYRWRLTLAGASGFAAAAVVGAMLLR